MRINRLMLLCDKWEKQAIKRFSAAEEESDGFSKKGLEHGAVIYFNVARELRTAIHSKFSFDFIFKIFSKYFKSP